MEKNFEVIAQVSWSYWSQSLETGSNEQSFHFDLSFTSTIYPTLSSKLRHPSPRHTHLLLSSFSYPIRYSSISSTCPVLLYKVTYRKINEK